MRIEAIEIHNFKIFQNAKIENIGAIDQLHPHSLEALAEKFREHAISGGQVFISSHFPDLVDAFEPDELFVLKKQKNGYSEIKAISENKQVVELYEAGDKLGCLWRQGLL